MVDATPAPTMDAIAKQFESHLNDLRADVSRLVKDHPTHAEVEQQIAAAVQPLNERMTSMQNQFVQMHSSISRIDGSLNTLTTLRGERMEAVQRAVEEGKSERGAIKALITGIAGDLREVRQDVYGSMDTPHGPPSLYGLLDKQLNASHQLAASLDNLSKSIDARIMSLETRFDEDHRYIESRKLWEGRLLKHGLGFGKFLWHTWKGRAVAAGVGLAAAVVLIEQARPGFFAQLFGGNTP